MSTRAVQPDVTTFIPDAPFRYVGGDPSVDLVNTVNWTDRGLDRDRLTDYARLLEWARGAGVLNARELRRFRSVMEMHPRRAATTFAAIRNVRAVLQRLFSSVAEGRGTGSSLEEFNALLADAAPHLRVMRTEDGSLVRGWDGFGDSAESIVWPVIWSAAELLASSDAAQLRVCAGSECGWIYVDRSRNGLRRWCEMGTCGTSEKNRRRAKR